MKRNLSVAIIVALAVSFGGVFPVNASAAALDIPLPPGSTFRIEPSGNHSFGTVTIPYDAPEAYVVTATLTQSGGPRPSSLAASLSGDNSDSFTLDTEYSLQLPVEPLKTMIKLTVLPKAGLAAGTYRAKVTVSAFVMTTGEIFGSRSFDVSFTVSDFGVPSTGVPDVTGTAAATLVFAIVSSALWAYILNRKFKERHNG